MYDPVFNETFTMRTKDTKWWDGGEPIWITTKKGGLRSASYFWPGSDTKLQNIRPDIWLPYKESTPFKQRVNDVIEWFTKKNINMVSLYFHEPDSTGHRYGPDSNEVIKEVEDMDQLLGYLVQQFDDNGLLDKVNMMITSDHGMTGIDVRNRVIDISELVGMDLINDVYNYDAIAQIIPKTRQTEKVYDALSNPGHAHMSSEKQAFCA